MIAATAGILLEVEELFHEQFPHGTILRPCRIYGPGRTRLIDKVGPGDTAADAAWTNRIHRDDAAAVAVHLLTMDAQPLTLHLGTDDQPTPEREVLEHLSQELGAPIAHEEPADEALRRTTKRLSNRQLRDRASSSNTPPTGRAPAAADPGAPAAPRRAPRRPRSARPTRPAAGG